MPLSGKTLKLIGPLLWDADHARVDLRKDKRAIIERVLLPGSD